MPTSGTANWNINILDIIEEAYERIGVEVKGGYEIRTARRSLNLLSMEWANRGLNLWCVDQETLALTPGTASYDLPADTIDVLDGVIRTYAGQTNNQTDVSITRISFVTYNTLPNKLVRGTPIQYYVARDTDVPRVFFWQVPDDTISRQFVYYRLRRQEDVGQNANNNLDVPFRFVPAMISGLAYQLASKRPSAFARMGELKAIYEEDFARAADEDRQRSSVMLVPGGFGR
jgi:hypothetical protein